MEPWLHGGDGSGRGCALVDPGRYKCRSWYHYLTHVTSKTCARQTSIGTSETLLHLIKQGRHFASLCKGSYLVSGRGKKKVQDLREKIQAKRGVAPATVFSPDLLMLLDDSAFSYLIGDKGFAQSLGLGKDKLKTPHNSAISAPEEYLS